MFLEVERASGILWAEKANSERGLQGGASQVVSSDGEGAGWEGSHDSQPQQPLILGTKDWFGEVAEFLRRS